MRAGGVCLLIPNPRDIPGFVKELQKYKVNNFPAVNTLYNALLNHPDFGKIDFSQLKIAIGGGMAVQRAVAERWIKATGVPDHRRLRPVGDLADAHLQRRGDCTEFTGTIGLPVPSTEISIRDDDGNEVPLGSAGRDLRARSAGDGRLLAAAGRDRAGDDQGRLLPHRRHRRDGRAGAVKIVDRKKDMVLVSGFNVYPNEVEDVIAMHPGVLECAVIGVPDAARARR